jgi:hypothetical protein
VESVALKVDKQQLIGVGNYSTCYLGKLHGTPVAVKQLKINRVTEKILQSFNHEVGLMR